MSLKMRVKNPAKFRIFEIYFACIKFREFDYIGNTTKISTFKVIEFLR